MLRKSRTGKFQKNLTEMQPSKNSDLNFNLMKSILGHINSTTNEDNNIVAVPVYVISMTKDDDKIITGDNNGSIKLLSSRTGCLIEVFKSHEKAINDLKQIDEYLISVSEDRGIGFWHLKKLKLLSILYLDEAIIQISNYQYKDKSGKISEILIFCSCMGKIYILNFEEIKELFKENEDSNNNELVDLSQIEINRLYLESKIIERYSLKKQKNNMQQSCMVAGGDGLLINGYNEGLLCIWDLKKILKEVIDNKRFLCNFEQYLIFLEYVHNAMIHICEFNNTIGSHFITGSIDGSVLIWKIQNDALEHFRQLANPASTYNISSLIHQRDIISGNMSTNLSNTKKNNFTYPIFNIFKISDTDKRTRCSVNAAAWTCQNNYLVAMISSKPKRKNQSNKQQNIQNQSNGNLNETFYENTNTQNNFNTNRSTRQNRENSNSNNQKNSEDFQKRTSSIHIYCFKENKIINRLSEENGFFFNDENYVLEAHPKYEEIILTVINTNEIIILDIFKSEILKKFKEENYFFTNIPYNMVALEGKFSSKGDSFVISTYIGSISIYSIYSKNSYSATYMNQFFGREFSLRENELSCVFPDYVNMYNLPYITQQPYSKFKLDAIMGNKRLKENYQMSEREINRKIFDNCNYTEKTLLERQIDCANEEKAFIEAAKDNITYMLNDENSSEESSLFSNSEENDNNTRRTNRNRNNNRNSNSNMYNNNNINNNNINIVEENKENDLEEFGDYDISSSFDEFEDLEDERIINSNMDMDVDSNDNLGSNFSGKKRRRKNRYNFRNNQESDRAKRWKLRSDENKNSDLNEEESKNSYDNSDNNFKAKRPENRYSKSLRQRSRNLNYNYDNQNNFRDSERKESKKLRKRLGIRSESNTNNNNIRSSSRTRLGLRNLSSVRQKNNIIQDEESDIEEKSQNSQGSINQRNDKLNLRSNSGTINNNINQSGNSSNRRNTRISNSNKNRNSSYSLRGQNQNTYSNNNISVNNIERSSLRNSSRILAKNPPKISTQEINIEDFQLESKRQKNSNNNNININNNNIQKIEINKNFAKTLNNTNLNIIKNPLNIYEKKKINKSENSISSFRDTNYNPNDFIRALPNKNLIDFIFNLILQNENKIEKCEFCNNKSKNIIGPFYKNFNNIENFEFFSIKKFPDFENEEELFFHIDCLILFNENIYQSIEIFEKENLQENQLDKMLTKNEQIISDIIKSTINLNLICFRCNEKNATIKCTNEKCEKYFHGNICVGKYCIILNKSLYCFDCARDIFLLEEKNRIQNPKDINVSQNYLKYFKEISREFFKKEKFSFFSYYPQIGEKVYFILQAYEDYLKKYHQYIIFEQKENEIYFWKNLEEVEISKNNFTLFNPYIPFECEVVDISFNFNGIDTINYLRKIHRGSYKDKLNLFIKITLNIFEINKQINLIFVENFEPDFLINSINYEINNKFYLDLQKNYSHSVKHFSIIDTIFGDVIYKAKVIEICAKETNKNFINSPFENLITIYEDSKINSSIFYFFILKFLVEKQNLSFWDINNEEMMQKKHSELGYEKFFEIFAKKFNNFITKNNNTCKFFLNEVDEEKDCAEDYYAKIAVPCYLNLIVKRLENSYYKTFKSLAFDFEIIKWNCITYNGQENFITECIMKMFDSVVKIFKDVLASLAFDEEFIENIFMFNKDKDNSNSKDAENDLDKSVNNIINNKRSLRNCRKNKGKITNNISEGENEYHSNEFDVTIKKQINEKDKEKDKDKEISNSNVRKTRRNKSEINYTENSPNKKPKGNELNHIELEASFHSSNDDDNLLKNTRNNKRKLKNNSKVKEIKLNLNETRSLRTRKNMKFNYSSVEEDFDKINSDDSEKIIRKKHLKDSFDKENSTENNLNGKMLGRKRNKNIIKFEI